MTWIVVLIQGLALQIGNAGPDLLFKLGLKNLKSLVIFTCHEVRHLTGCAQATRLVIQASH